MSKLLTLVNLSDCPIEAAAVPLDAGRIYKALQLKPGTPLEAVWPDARPLELRFEQETGTLWLLGDLPARGKALLKVRPAKQWPEARYVRASWDRKGSRGELTNGIVTVRLDGRTASLLLPNGEVVFDDLRFYGWLAEKNEPVPSPGVAAERGLARLLTADFKSLEVDVGASGPLNSKLVLTKEAAGNAAGIVYREKFAIRPWSPVVEYRLEVENRRSKPVYIADCDGIIFGRWGKAMAAAKMLQIPTKVKRAVTTSWMGISERQIPATERTWMVIHSGQRALGIVNLLPRTHNWCFTEKGFWLYQAGPEGERPIKIAPGGSVSFGLAFAVFCERTGAFEGTKSLFRKLGRGRASLLAKPPVSAFFGGKPVSGGRVACLREDFAQPHRWLVEGGRLGNAGRFTCEGDSAQAVCALDIAKRGPKLLRLEVAELTGTLEIAARPLTGGRAFSARVDKPGKHEWMLEIEGDFVLEISLLGKGSEAVFKSLYVGPEPLPAPELISPSPNAKITDIAAFFKWRFVEDAEEYDVQLSRADGFEEALSFEAPELNANVAVLFPEKPLLPGKWFWRVRAIGEGGAEGEWSEARSFAVNGEHPKRPLVRPISREKPLFILHSPSEIEQAWRAVPEDLRPYCALRVEVSERMLDFFRFCNKAERAGASMIIQCSGPGGGVYGEVYGRSGRGRYGRPSLADIEWAFQTCPHVIGVTIVEQFFHHFSDPTSREYAKRLIQLCAKYGRSLFWADGHWVRLGWLKLGADPEMMRLFEEHKAYVVPLWKMNCGWEPLTIHGAVLGLWLCGKVDNYGVEPEDWFWFEAGYLGLGKTVGQFKTGNRELCPPTFWAQMMLMGMASGATCWCLEPCSGMWERGRPDTMRQDTFVRVIAPLMRAIVEHELIPSKEEVLSNVKAACKVEPDDLRKIDDFFGPFRALFEGTYGLKHRHELIPNRGRYYFIPLLPILCQRPPEGVRLFGTSQVAKPGDANELFDRLYPLFYEGDAFVIRVGDLILATNSHENEDVQQAYRVPLDWGVFNAVGGSLGPHNFVIFKRDGAGLWLHVNNRADRCTKLTIEAPRRPTVKVEPHEALIAAEWDAGRGQLNLEIGHRNGAVEAIIR